MNTLKQFLLIAGGGLFLATGGMESCGGYGAPTPHPTPYGNPAQPGRGGSKMMNGHLYHWNGHQWVHDMHHCPLCS